MWLYHTVMSQNDADGMANSVDPDQTAPLDTLKILIIGTPEKVAVIILKYECVFTMEQCARKIQMEWQTVCTLIRSEQSDLGLHCLPKPVCPKT